MYFYLIPTSQPLLLQTRFIAYSFHDVLCFNLRDCGNPTIQSRMLETRSSNAGHAATPHSTYRTTMGCGSVPRYSKDLNFEVYRKHTKSATQQIASQELGRMAMKNMGKLDIEFPAILRNILDTGGGNPIHIRPSKVKIPEEPYPLRDDSIPGELWWTFDFRTSVHQPDWWRDPHNEQVSFYSPPRCYTSNTYHC